MLDVIIRIENAPGVIYNSVVIIDSHTHIFSTDVIANRERYCNDDYCFDLLYSSQKAKLLSAEDLIESMDKHGIARSAVLNIGWRNHDLCVRSNDYILESITRYPSRLVGFCSVYPAAGDAALNEIERCRQAGARGLGELRPDAQGYSLRDINFCSPVFNLAIKLDMLVILHASEPVGHKYAGKGELTPDILFDFARDFHDLKIVMAHFGGGLPFYALMPEVAEVLSNVYYDTAAAPFLYRPEIYNTLTGIVGNDRLLFGSDWPLLDQSRVLSHIQSGEMSQDDMAKILYINAERLLG